MIDGKAFGSGAVSIQHNSTTRCGTCIRMMHFPAPPDERLTTLILGVLTHHGRVPAEPGWYAEVAPGGSTDRTFSVIDPAGEPRLTARLARPGLVERLRHERRILQELVREAATQSVNLSDRGEPVPRQVPTPEPWTPGDITLVEDDALPERWLLVHEHMRGQPVLLAEVTATARERFGECLAWVHSHQRDGYTIWPSLAAEHGTRADLYHARLDTLRRYQATKGRLPDAPALIERLAGADLSPSAGWHERDFALCHGDLSIGNILWDGDAVALIDWEFARDGDPAEDIAYLAAEQDLTPDLIAEIAEAYVAAGGDPWALARLPAWLPLVALDAALWWADYDLAQGVDPTIQPDVVIRLDRARNFLRN